MVPMISVETLDKSPNFLTFRLSCLDNEGIVLHDIENKTKNPGQQKSRR